MPLNETSGVLISAFWAALTDTGLFYPKGGSDALAGVFVKGLEKYGGALDGRETKEICCHRKFG